jgi:hypothetical protein
MRKSFFRLLCSDFVHSLLSMLHAPFVKAEVIYENSSIETEENHKKTENRRSRGRDLNPRPPQYETGVLYTCPRRSVRRWLFLSWAIWRHFSVTGLYSVQGTNDTNWKGFGRKRSWYHWSTIPAWGGFKAVWNSYQISLKYISVYSIGVWNWLRR